MLRELITINPRAAAPKSNPRKKSKKKHAVKYHRNPRGFAMPAALREFSEPIVPAIVGGVGALGVDMLIGAATFIPPEWKAGTKRAMLRAGVAFLAGIGGRFALPPKFRRYSDQATAGALTVVAYDLLKGFAVEQWPTLTLGAYTSDLSEYQRVSYDALPSVARLQGRNGGMGAYVNSGEMSGLAPAVR